MALGRLWSSGKGESPGLQRMAESDMSTCSEFEKFCSMGQQRHEGELGESKAVFHFFFKMGNIKECFSEVEGDLENSEWCRKE